MDNLFVKVADKEFPYKLKTNGQLIFLLVSLGFNLV